MKTPKSKKRVQQFEFIAVTIVAGLGYSELEKAGKEGWELKAVTEGESDGNEWKTYHLQRKLN